MDPRCERAQTLRRYRLTPSGTKTSRMPAHHASDCSTKDAVGPPIMSARTAEAVTDTGWYRAKGCSQPGMLLTFTNAEDAKISGATTGKAAACAVSGSPTASPTLAKIHDST